MVIKDFFSNLNIEINGFLIENVAEKIGALFGEEARAIGKKIDDLTKDMTIRLDTDKEE